MRPQARISTVNPPEAPGKLQNLTTSILHMPSFGLLFNPVRAGRLSFVARNCQQISSKYEVPPFKQKYLSQARPIFA
ncbi:hypothetical protein VTI74DRAFT_3089 [Chaetomium olivicolor]